jgi:pantoate--beta-alanine ligase
MYPKDLPFSPMPLGRIGELLEGAHRPGHFEGVVHVVHHLFALVQPQKAYFGQKDFQQLAIIRLLNNFYGFGIDIIGCETVREADGLAMSSRNVHLSPTERAQSLALYQSLMHIKEGWGKKSVAILKQEATEFLEKSPGISLGYLEICATNNLQNNSPKEGTPAVALVAASLGQTRLIDNILLP